VSVYGSSSYCLQYNLSHTSVVCQSTYGRTLTSSTLPIHVCSQYHHDRAACCYLLNETSKIYIMIDKYRSVLENRSIVDNFMCTLSSIHPLTSVLERRERKQILIGYYLRTDTRRVLPRSCFSWCQKNFSSVYFKVMIGTDWISTNTVVITHIFFNQINQPMTKNAFVRAFT
jgi:hypothetical protein